MCMMDSGIQEVCSGDANFSSEFDAGVTFVQITDEGVKFSFTCSPDRQIYRRQRWGLVR